MLNGLRMGPEQSSASRLCKTRRRFLGTCLPWPEEEREQRSVAKSSRLAINGWAG